MIEVEKKFLINENDIKELLKGTEFINEEKFTDTYWDTPDYSLTTKDIWLRSRDGKFELKVPMLGNGKRLIDQYEELDSDDRIADRLNLSGNNLEEMLKNASYHPFASITTLRRKYSKEEFIIDVDEVDFGYNIVEVELMVKDKDEVEGAINKILSFAKYQNLKVSQVRGKLIEYLRRNDPGHYKALVDAGVVNE